MSQKNQFVVLEKILYRVDSATGGKPRLCVPAAKRAIRPWERDTGGMECTETCIHTAKAVSPVLPIKVLDGGQNNP